MSSVVVDPAPIQSGISDEPSTTDNLGVSHYFDGLADFITCCPTPMTIAVQGDWGSGKTSAMQMVEARIASPRTSGPGASDVADKPISTLWFNTWQYDQFDVSDNLALSLIRAIGDELQKVGPEDGKPKVEQFRRRVIQVLGIVAEKSVVIAAKSFLPVVGEQIEKGLDEIHKKGTPSTPAEAAVPRDAAALLTDLRAEFAEAIIGTGRRWIIFVDDLDRLQPLRAVEVMEAIKLFLDVKNCVFVLAIDAAVVRAGVRQKYGKGVDDRKARAFFDKIIQVPFQMPVGAYELHDFFRKRLLEAGVVESVENDLSTFVKLAEYSVSVNPRSTKRLINTFVLLRTILSHRRPSGDGVGEAATANPTDTQLFAVLGLQAGYPKVYDALSQIELHTGGSPWDSPELESGAEGDQYPRAWDLTDDEAKRLTSFLVHLKEVFSRAGSFDAIAFRDAMGKAAITSVSTTNAAPSTRRTETDAAEKRALLIRAHVPEAIVDLGFALQGSLEADGIVFGAYQDGTTWSLYLPGRGRILGQLRFTRSSLRVDFCNRTSFGIDTATEFFNRANAVFSEASEDTRAVVSLQEQNGLLVRVAGITTPADLARLTPILRDVLRRTDPAVTV